MEAANFAVRYYPQIKRYYQRKRAKTNGVVAIKTVAHKLARACYYILRDQVIFEVGESLLGWDGTWKRGSHDPDYGRHWGGEPEQRGWRPQYGGDAALSVNGSCKRTAPVLGGRNSCPPKNRGAMKGKGTAPALGHV